LLAAAVVETVPILQQTAVLVVPVDYFMMQQLM
jgi:hypothetical protein